MTWTPKGWWTPTADVDAALRLGQLCDCEPCTRDGQHNPLCEVHHLPPLACDCARGETPPPTSIAIPSGAS